MPCRNHESLPGPLDDDFLGVVVERLLVGGEDRERLAGAGQAAVVRRIGGHLEVVADAVVLHAERGQDGHADFLSRSLVVPLLVPFEHVKVCGNLRHGAVGDVAQLGVRSDGAVLPVDVILDPVAGLAIEEDLVAPVTEVFGKVAHRLHRDVLDVDRPGAKRSAVGRHGQARAQPQSQRKRDGKRRYSPRTHMPLSFLR